MDTFSTTLKEVTADADAAHVAAMLRDDLPRYKKVAGQVQPEQMHPFIREVRAAALESE